MVDRSRIAQSAEEAKAAKEKKANDDHDRRASALGAKKQEEAAKQQRRQYAHGAYCSTTNNPWFSRKASWCFDSDAGQVPAVVDNTPTGRVLLQPWSDEGPAKTNEAAVAPARPLQGRLSQVRHNELFQAHEDCIRSIHGTLQNFGTDIGTCTSCGRREPGITASIGGCPTCTMNPPRSNAGVETAPARFSFENGMSLSPLHNTGGEGAQRERDLLRRLLASMTQAELGLIRTATPCISYHRLPGGGLGFKGHAISLYNGGPTIALTLPRSPHDAGVSIIVDPGRDKNNALDDPSVKRYFRVRRRVVEQVLRLLIKHNKNSRLVGRRARTRCGLSLVGSPGASSALRASVFII